jgi:hypothetical protein
MTEPGYNEYLDTLAALVNTDHAYAEELAGARTRLRDATEGRARVARQTETLLGLVRDRLARAGLSEVTPAKLARPPADGRPPSAALDVANRLAAQLSATADALVAHHAEAVAQAEREAADRARWRVRLRVWALAALVLAILAGGIFVLGLRGGS